MSCELPKFQLSSSRIPAPRHWHLQALYESPLAIAAHLTPDKGHFLLDPARDALLQWLSTVDQTARSVDVARPVVACLEVSCVQREAIDRWENEAAWRASGHVLYVDKTKDDAQKRLERVLFRSVDEALLDDKTTHKSAEDQIRCQIDDSLSPEARSLMEGLLDVLRHRKEKAHPTDRKEPEIDLKAQVGELLRVWQLQPTIKPAFGSAGAQPKGTPAEGSKAAPPDLPERRSRVERLRKVSLLRFRGWCGPNGHDVDVDADLVVLAGPNGHGKSTFLEALMLLLTGYMRRDPDSLRPRTNGGSSEGDTEIRSEPKHGEADSIKPLGFTLSPAAPASDGETSDPHLSMPPRSGFWHDFYTDMGNQNEASKGEMNLCAVFADQLHERFDHKRNADNLLNAFSASGRQITLITAAIQEAKNNIDAEIQDRSARVRRLRDPKIDAATRATIFIKFEMARPAYEQFTSLYAHYEEGKPELPSWLSPEGSDDERLSQIESTLDTLARLLGIESRDKLAGAIKASVEAWKEREKETGLYTQDLELLGRLEGQRADLERRYPRARERVEPFRDTASGPSLDDCLASLTRNLDRWREASLQAGLRMMAEQLGRVIPDDLQRLSDLASQHVREHREAAEKVEQLDREIETIRQKIEQSERFQAILSIEESEDLQALWRALEERRTFEASIKDAIQLEAANRRAEEVRNALDEVEDRLNPFLLHPSLCHAFKRVLNDVLGRIHISPGILPVTIEDDGTVGMGDERTIDDLSTGQKTQLAVALSVGINLAVSSTLGTAVIAMDDVSAAYDVSNIAREATFWRVVAYGYRADAGMTPHNAQRRQLFLSSHNEATTRRLIDLLRPPGGATMKVIRFKGWSPENGPDYDVDDVRSASASDDTTRERLVRELAHSLRRNP